MNNYLHPKRFLKENGDLVALLLLGLGLPFMPLLTYPALRLPLSLIAILFAPGYALAVAISVWHDNSGAATRLGVSFGLSLMILPLLSLVLNVLPWGLQVEPMAVALSIWILAGSTFTLWKRWRARGVSQLTGAKHWRFITLSIGLILALTTLVFVFVFSSSVSQATEFYILGSSGQAEKYPIEVIAGRPVQVQLGIVSHEETATHYRIEAHLHDKLLTTMDSPNLESGQKWEQPLQFSLTEAGKDQQVELWLLRDGDSTPYRRLYLWLNAQESFVP